MGRGEIISLYLPILFVNSASGGTNEIYLEKFCFTIYSKSAHCVHGMVRLERSSLPSHKIKQRVLLY